MLRRTASFDKRHDALVGIGLLSVRASPKELNNAERKFKVDIVKPQDA